MSLSLATFPAEVLEGITCAVSDLIAIFRLSLCGNKVLNAKLQHGGLSTAVYPWKGLPNSHIKFLHSHRLFSITLTDSKAPVSALKQLIHGLPSTLRCLKVYHSVPSRLFCLEDFDLEESPFLTNGTDLRAWIVSKSFPQLETLHIVTPTSCLGDKPIIDFLLGLPPSLTDLCAPMITNRVVLDIWRILPPNITRLGRITTVLPSKFSSPQVMNNLRSLEILTANDATFNEVDKNRARRLGCVSALQMLVWPSNLTELRIISPLFSALENFPVFPPSLTRLEWTDQGLRLRPLAFLRLLPSSLTYLNIASVVFNKPTEDEESSVVFRKLKFCKLRFSSSSRFLQLRAYLLKAFSDVEYLEFDQSDAEDGLSPAELALLNPSTVRTLKTSLSKACFHEVDDDFQLSQKLPNLTSLSLMRPDASTFVFTFEAIPRSVTHLDLGECSVSTQTMQHMPPGLKVLKATRLIGHGKHNFETLFFEPIPSLLPEARPSTHPSHYLDLTKFEPLKHHTLEKYEVGSGSNKSVRFFLRSVEVHQLPFQRQSPAPNADIRINWDRTLALPSTLTSLRLSPPLANIRNSTLTPELLPNLTKLRLELPLSIDFGAFPLLKSLHVDSLRNGPKALFSRCPPCLTSLRSDNELYLAEELLPFPESLTELHAGLEVSPLSMLSRIPNLKSFGCRSVEWTSQEASTIISTIPTSLRHIEATYEGPRQLELTNIGTRFRDLETFTIKHSRISLSLLFSVEKSFPEHTRFIAAGALTDFDAVGLVLDRAGYSKGCIEVASDMVSFVSIALKRAFPRWSGLSVTALPMIMFPALESWIALTPYFSSSITELDLEATFTPLEPGFAPYLPRSITKLIVAFTSPEVDQLTVGLPPSLAHLVISAKAFTPSNIEALPRGITNLELRDLEDFSDEMALALPPSLLKLTLFGVRIPVKALQALPKTIVSLKLHFKHSKLDEPDFEALPPNLKSFEGEVEATARHHFFKFAASRSFSWLSRYSPDAMHLNDAQMLYVQNRFGITPPLDDKIQN